MASIGKGYWTFLFSAVGTLYFDEAKSWHASILARYEVNTEQDKTDIRMGDDFHFEWGIGKTLAQLENTVIDVGVAGYCSWRVNKDSGDNASDFKEGIYAIGSELGITYLLWATSFTFRYVWEFENKNAPQGGMATLAITKVF